MHYHSVELANLVSLNVQIIDQDVDVELCYHPGTLSTPISLYDDFVLNLPNGGNFNLNATVYRSSDPDTCQIISTIYSRTINFNFPLSQPVSLSNDQVELAKEIQLYPNPTKDTINLSIPDSTIIDQIDLFDLTGRKVQTFDPTRRSFNLTKLKTGVYIISVSSSGGTFNKKIVLR